MKNIAYCTMTYGNEYIKLGDNLIKQINDMGYHMFVLTNQPNHYKSNDLLTIIEYKKPYFSFHEKKEIVKECLKYYESAFFLDCDVFIKDTNDLSIFENIENGIHIFVNFGSIGDTFLNKDISKCSFPNERNTKYGKEGEKFLKSLGLEYKKKYHNNSTIGFLEHPLEGRWILKKYNNLENKFFEIWDKISNFCEEFDIRYEFTNNIGAGEGAAMAIAAHNSGINLVSPSKIDFVNKYFISNYQKKIKGLVPWSIPG